MAFDFKKEFKEFYLPAATATIVTVPVMNYLAVRGKGDPNEEDGAYKHALELLYGIAYTLKMSYKNDYRIEGFFEYVVPPLEGLWWAENGEIDYANKDGFCFISMIRLPDFVTEKDVQWAIREATRKKKKIDFSQVEFLRYDEGLCVQCMHIGPYDDEPATIKAMVEYAQSQGYQIAIDDVRRHHEIYLGDPRKTSTEKLKTVIRYPIR